MTKDVKCKDFGRITRDCKGCDEYEACLRASYEVDVKRGSFS